MDTTTPTTTTTTTDEDTPVLDLTLTEDEDTITPDPSVIDPIITAYEETITLRKSVKGPGEKAHLTKVLTKVRDHLIGLGVDPTTLSPIPGVRTPSVMDTLSEDTLSVLRSLPI